MKMNRGLIRFFLTSMAAIMIIVGVGNTDEQLTFAAGGKYKILAWNDLGMHCYNRDFADLAVLPPYNTLWVQVVEAGDPPVLVTSGITVEYSYSNNTYSVGKTNFWTYAKDLFGVDLAPNIGLKGKGLSGTMDLVGDHYVAEGIPITEFSDSAPAVSDPYQLATVVVKDAVTRDVLATTQVVTPTSSEMRCDTCHGDTGIAAPETPTGKVETNILKLHDEENGTSLMANRPVLCAECHGSNALGMLGRPGMKNLSNSMHEKHAEIIPDTLAGCYNCHPGPQTRCLRDVMYTEEGMTCIDCHGGMSAVASNPYPWLKEPRCDTCHDADRFGMDQPLYRLSKSHGGLYCAACHDSPHAVAPSRESNDALKFINLQGHNGPLENCSVCHTDAPSSDSGPHQITILPLSPRLILPANGSLTSDYTPRLVWSAVSMPIFDHYQLQLATDEEFNAIVLDEDIADAVNSGFTVKTDLDPNTRYFWRVRSFNTNGQFSVWSAVWSFRTALPPPELISPEDGEHVMVLRPSFDWQDVDGASGYTIQIARSASFTQIVHTGNTVESSYVPTVDLPKNVPLFWRVQSKGANGPSFWSEAPYYRSFITPNLPPAPVLLQPASNAVVTDYRPEFKWKPVVMPADTELKNYFLQVDNDLDFSSPELDVNTILSTSYRPNLPLSTNTKFYWRVRAVNTLGEMGNWSRVRTFRSALLPLELNALPNNDHPLTLRPTFSWHDPNADNSFTTGYSIQVSTSSTFSVIVHNASVQAGVTTYTPGINLPAGKLLYWRVRANGSNGSSLWVSRSFTSPMPPSVPLLLLPAKDSLNQNYTPLLEWSIVTVTAPATFARYQIQVDDDPLFASPLVDNTSFTRATQNQFITPPLAQNTRFYWRVLAYNTLGQFSMSAVSSFRTQVDAPALLAPVNEAKLTTLTPAFDWQDATGPGAISGYTIQISASPAFTGLIVNTTTTTSTYTRTVSLPAGKMLYWRVRVNGVNGPSEWSSVFVFTTP